MNNPFLTEGTPNEPELFRRTIKTISRGRKNSRMRTVPLWSLVAHYCSTGSTSAKEICRHYDLDPDMKVRP